MWDPSCALVRQWEQNIQYKSFDAGKKILWDLTPSQTPESGSYRSPMSPNYRKPSILLSSAQETTWGCSCKCCDWLCVLHHGSWRRCSSQSGHGWHSAAWLSHLGKRHISLCSWFQPFPPACLQQVLKVTLQWQLHSALLINLPENPNQMELKQGNTFLHLQTCLSAAETQQRVCYRCFAGCSRLRSGRRGCSRLALQVLRAARGIFSCCTRMGKNWASCKQYLCCILPSSFSHHLGALMKRQGAGRKKHRVLQNPDKNCWWCPHLLLLLRAKERENGSQCLLRAWLFFLS